MPSSKNYVRDYKQEARAESPERREQRAQRVKARRMAEAYYGKSAIKGKDIDHKRPLSKGGSNSMSNLRVSSPSKNRSYARTSSGAMKSSGRKK
jgi:5-methylcytosine-specific restriction endonuclease McrA